MSKMEQPETEGAPKLDRAQLRTALTLASYVKDSPFKILPGSTWAPHYPDSAGRQQILERVLKGELSPDEVDADSLKPDGFTYAFRDVEQLGVDGLLGQIRERSAFYEYFNYREYMQFLHGLQGRDIDLDAATEMFSSVTQTRVQSELMRTLGATGRAQVRKSLKAQAGRMVSEEIEAKGRIPKMMDVLKARWLAEQGMMAPHDKAKIESGAGSDVRDVADQLESAYAGYAQTGSADAREALTNAVRDSSQEIQKQQDEDRLDDFAEKVLQNPDALPPELKQQLDQAFNDFSPPQGDTPPSFQSSFSPSMDPMKETTEGQKAVPLYSIEPPLKGLYQGPVYNSFNAREVQWEMNPRLQKVASASGPRQHAIKGKIAPGTTIPIFLPRNFTLAPFSLPQELSVLRDEQGCFYLENKGGAEVEYELGFGRQPAAHNALPSAADTADIGSAALSQATMNYIKSLRGRSNVEKAAAIVHYMKNVLKLEYSNDPQYNRIYKQNPSRYFAEIERHKQVDCDVAQTYFIALCRAAGMASRIVIGHNVSHVEDGKAMITSGTGHAWTEIWDDQAGAWKTIDATPEKTDEDKSKKKKEESAPEEDADIKAPKQEPRDSKEPPSTEEVQQKVDEAVQEAQEQGESGKPDASGIPSSAREKMKEMMEGQQDQQGQQGQQEEGAVPEDEWQDLDQEMKEGAKDHEKRTQKAQELKNKTDKAENFDDLQKLEDEMEASDMYDEDKERLKNLLEAKEQQRKEQMKREIEKMRDEGFLDADKANQLLENLKEDNPLSELAEMEQDLGGESSLYNEYEEIRKEVMPLVDQWFRFFADRLPKIEEPDFDEDVLSRRGGHFARRSFNKPRNLIFGITQHPPIIREAVQPRFIASLVLDISGSMGGRMKDARKLLIFFAELFDRISREYGYIQFSVSVFDDAVELIKDFDYEYSAAMRYNYGAAGNKTVKYRLMEMTMARGGTDMGRAVWEANSKLNALKRDFPNYLTALYTISDGETQGQLAGDQLRRFLAGQEAFWGQWWGKHMKCGFMLGPAQQKAILAQYFGDKDSEAVPETSELIKKIMMRFDRDVQFYISQLPKD